MPEHTSNATAAAQADIAAALMGLGRRLDAASLMLSAAALIVLALTPPAPWACAALLAAVVAGLGEHAHALRTAFDAPLFAAWAQRWQARDADPQADLSAFDQALADTGLGPAGAGATRSLQARIAGARRLLQRQGLFLVLQLAAWLGAVALIIWPH
ncbi:MAG: hypothetical protein GAK35_03766 [Herbaspirillum frisingense]|uniref:Uncharacterized protein n=1 Tax=Herbaspirillum frisingense TaxID=92645 RepID=A0A7V8FTP9_9BURK|nr:MAG: hypothetical protein GAK35_03766 [Herbaspirillum frisingense]